MEDAYGPRPRRTRAPRSTSVSGRKPRGSRSAWGLGPPRTARAAFALASGHRPAHRYLLVSRLEIAGHDAELGQGPGHVLVDDGSQGRDDLGLVVRRQGYPSGVPGDVLHLPERRRLHADFGRSGPGVHHEDVIRDVGAVTTGVVLVQTPAQVLLRRRQARIHDYDDVVDAAAPGVLDQLRGQRLRQAVEAHTALVGAGGVAEVLEIHGQVHEIVLAGLGQLLREHLAYLAVDVEAHVHVVVEAVAEDGDADMELLGLG